MSDVNVLIHHRVGTEVRVTTLVDVPRREAHDFLLSIGRLRASDGTLTLGPHYELWGLIPAQNIEYVEVKAP